MMGLTREIELASGRKKGSWEIEQGSFRRGKVLNFSLISFPESLSANHAAASLKTGRRPRPNKGSESEAFSGFSSGNTFPRNQIVRVAVVPSFQDHEVRLE